MGYPFYHLRGKDVMSDNELAVFFAVDIFLIRFLVNHKRTELSRNCVFEIAPEDMNDWMDQFVLLDGEMIMYRPVYFFTEFGIFMLSVFLPGEIAWQFSRAVAGVLFSPQNAAHPVPLSEILVKMNKDERLKALWATYRQDPMDESPRKLHEN
jgi:hypothetical protein